MASIFRKIITIILFTVFISNQAKAQSKTQEFINVSAGLGYSFPDDQSAVSGSGFYVQGEYVFNLTKWFGIRPYAGFILTHADKNDYVQNHPEYKVTSNSFLFGGKIRVTGPIPWVAPYFEIGIGASVGSFKTNTPLNYVKGNGIVMHIPFSLGLALGRKHDVDIAFTYYETPSIRQTTGAAAIGLSFPLK